MAFAYQQLTSALQMFSDSNSSTTNSSISVTS
jgi:hypothetical protein